MSTLKNTTFVEAIREGIFQSLKKDKKLFLMGEGVDDPSSMWGTIKGVRKAFGPKRLIEMPVAENGLIGTAIGSSMAGSKVIVNLQRVEFALYALEQIINNAAKAHYISRGKHTVPIVIRMVIGRGWGQGPEHGQSLENLFSMIPGLKVVIPAFPHEAKNLMISSIFDKNPVIFLEHRWSHFSTGKVSKKFEIKKLKNFSKLSNGNSLTVVSSSINSIEALRVQKLLKKYSINLELFNMTMTSPLDCKEIINSVKKTKKLITIDLGHKFCNLGSEIITQVMESGVKFDKKPVRLGLPFHPVPSSRGLVEDFYPNSIKLMYEIFKMMNVNKKKQISILNEFKHNKTNLPIDVPDPYFKGPF